MSLQKRAVPIPFALGMDRKTDPWQIPLGKFYNLTNSIFTKAKRLTKRNGNQQLTVLSGDPASLSTFNSGLVAVGSTLNAFADGTDTWINKGTYQPLSLSTQSLIRSGANQTQCDVAVASNGLICAAYTETANGITSYKYAVFDSTNACIVNPTALAGTAGSVTGGPRVFALGRYFVIVFTVTITATAHLQYVAIPTNNPGTPLAATDISATYTPASTVAFDGVVANNTLYLAWNASGAAGIKMTFITSTLTQGNTTNPDSAHVATMVSVTADTSGNTPVIWVSYYDSGGSTGYTLAVTSQLVAVLAATQFISSGTVLNLTSSATAGVNRVFYEVSTAYTYDSAIKTNLLKTNTITQAGSVGTASNLIRGMGLAAKSFLVDGSSFVLGVYSSPTQPTYFLLNSSGKIVAKLAYANGGGYLTLGLPSAVVNDTEVTFGYLFKDLIEPVNKEQGASFSAGVYTQTGVNAATFDFDAIPTTAEIGGALHISGGQLWMYDGTQLVEHGFHVWPDSVEVTWLAAQLTPTGTSNATTTLSSVSSTAGVAIGMTITGTNIAAGTTIVAFTANTITLSQAATGSGSGTTFTIGTTGTIGAKPDGSTNTNAYFYQVVYEWTDASGMIHRSAPSIPVGVTTSGSGSTGTNYIQVPTLRATLKTQVKILVYRWSVAQQVYYQVTSITNPTLNSTSVDFVTVTDTLADASIIGNSIIYTTGGVIENIGAPATDLVSLFDSRLFLVDAENKNTLRFSKEVIDGVPVEMSDLFTKFINPTLGAQGNTGPISVTAPMDDKFVMFKPNAAAYYFNGTGPDNTNSGNQYSQPVFIASTVGCTNPHTALSPNGIMFQSDKGIWILKRDLTTDYIGAPMEDFNSETVLAALTIPGTNQIRFSMSGGSKLVYDYYFDQWSIFTGIQAASSTLFQGLETSIDAYGRIFQENPGSYLDGSTPVLMSFTTSWIALAGLQGYQRAYWAFLLGRYLSPHKLVIGIAYNFNSTIRQQLTITPDNFTPNYGDEDDWGDGDFWGGPGDVEQWQINFKQQTCNSFQITLTEQYDPSLGQPAGAGLTLSGLNLVVGIKKDYPRRLPAIRKVG